VIRIGENWKRKYLDAVGDIGEDKGRDLTEIAERGQIQEIGFRVS